MKKTISNTRTVETRRSFSLLELIIAIALIVGLGAMLVPAMLRSMEERAFETARDLTDDQLAMARAHSQETGEAVEVIFRANPPRVETRVLGEFAEDDVDGGLGPVGAWDDGEATGGSVNGGAIAWGGGVGGRRSVELGRGMTMTAKRPSSSSDEFGANGGERAWGSGSGSSDLVSSHARNDGSHSVDSRESGSGDDVRLAVFMPDGSAVAGRPVWLRDEEGRMSRLTINAWTGMATFERVYEAEDAEPWVGEDEDVLGKGVGGF